MIRMDSSQNQKTDDELGNEYEDFIMSELGKYGVFISTYKSREYQYKVGEGPSGVEIKYDNILARTGNLYIEVQERRNADRPYVDSGIRRENNTLFWIIGNKDEAFLFTVRDLKWVDKKKDDWNLRTVENDKKTSIGILLPKELAMSKGLCLKRYDFREDVNRIGYPKGI